ncbi:MAG: hypothetical protein WCI73_09410 [Phycisphaerae bacterium]
MTAGKDLLILARKTNSLVKIRCPVLVSFGEAETLLNLPKTQLRGGLAIGVVLS